MRSIGMFLLLGIYVCCASPQQVIEQQSPLEAVHDALFSSLVMPEQLQQEPRLLAQLASVRDSIWSQSGQLPWFRELIKSFNDLSRFGTACGLEDEFRGKHAVSFAGLTELQREHVLTLLETCNQNEPRRVVMALRDFYVATTYTALQQDLADVDLNQYASDAWIEKHRPGLPASRLRFDHVHHLITSIDGPIDYLIVGSGPAGSVLAHELRRGGKRVLLVERGSFVEPGSMQTRDNGAFIDTRASDDGGILISNGEVVGGGSEVNIDLSFTPTSAPIQAKIEGWRREGRITADEFNKDQVEEAYKWVKASIGTRSLQESEINSNNRVLWEGACHDGLHPKLYNLNTYPPGQSPYPVTDKRSAESELLIDALQDTKNPLSMVPDAEVIRVLFESKNGDRQAIGVEVRMRKPVQREGVIVDPNHFGGVVGEVGQIRAKTIILSAGALGSPTILLRSGIDNPQIGRGVILHPSMPIIGRFDRTIDALHGTHASVYVDDHLLDRGYAFESMSAQPAYVALMSPGSPASTLAMVRQFHHLAGFGVMLVDNVSPDNRLVLDDTGEPQIHYQLSEADKARFRRGVAEAVRVMFLAGAREVYLPSTEDILGGTTEIRQVILTDINQSEQIEKHLQFIPNRTILTSAHMQATNKMGQDPRNSVVADDFHVWGTKNLFVVDGSVFPTSIGANPMESIYTFAKVFADRAIISASSPQGQ